MRLVAHQSAGKIQRNAAQFKLASGVDVVPRIGIYFAPTRMIWSSGLGVGDVFRANPPADDASLHHAARVSGDCIRSRARSEEATDTVILRGAVPNFLPGKSPLPALDKELTDRFGTPYEPRLGAETMYPEYIIRR